MLKSVLLAITFAFSIEGASAQFSSIFTTDESNAQRTFYGALTAGGNFSQVDGDTFSGYHQVGLNTGALVYVRLAGPLFASVELLYSQKGSKARYEAGSSYTGTEIDGYDLRLNYAEVAVVLHYSYKAHWAIGAGASYAQLISSKESAFSNGPVNIYPDVNYFRKEDICGLAELSYEFRQGWLISMRYSYSLRSIRDAERIPQGYGGGYFGGQYNNLFGLRLLYFFRGKSLN